MRLIDADVLLKEVRENKELFEKERVYLEGLLLNATTIIWCGETSDGLPLMDLRPRPQGEREFIEIITRYYPDDMVTYPEYKGKPYYSIHYRENGEEFVGYGTYNPDVLSRYLRDYFFGEKGGVE